MSGFTSEKVNYKDLIVGKTYRVFNMWYAYNYMNECMEVFTGQYVKKIQINNNINVIFLVNGYEKCVNGVNEFYLVE